MRIVQMNVRLREGGAAAIARSLHDELSELGHHSEILYGYARRGKRDAKEEQYAATQIGSPIRAIANIALHKAAGTDVVGPSRAKRQELLAKIRAADILHLHATHSYWLPLPILKEIVLQTETPIVWTAHDRWAVTGRCAIPGDCMRWLGGCGSCPELGAYPGARIDRTSSEFASRRFNMSAILNSRSSVAVACSPWLATDLERSGVFPELQVIPNSIDRVFYDAANAARRRPAHPSDFDDRYSLLFVNRDLRDPLKVNWSLLGRIADLPEVKLTIVGDNPPSDMPRSARWLPSIPDRVALAEEMVSHDGLIYTSQIETFSLVMAEAIHAGLKIHALPSEAASYMSGYGRVAIGATATDLAGELQHLVRHKDAQRSSAAGTPFQAGTMTSRYMQIYRDMADSRGN